MREKAFLNRTNVNQGIPAVPTDAPMRPATAPLRRVAETAAEVLSHRSHHSHHSHASHASHHSSHR